jgi:glutamine amidotransferase
MKPAVLTAEFRVLCQQKEACKRGDKVIAIIDYGVGNLRSVEKAIQHVGGSAHITSDFSVIKKADAVILPGVGAFGDAMLKINKNGMSKVVKEVIKDNKPFLGICLGMQMLFEYSEEGEGMTPGLGILKGNIKKFPASINVKIPHMGWNTVKFEKDIKLFDGIQDNSYFYFVHSYYLESNDRDIVAASTCYGINFDSAIAKDNIYATQYHPEKSGNQGLLLLKNFVDIIG